jgi:hypothetical protein
MLLDAQQVAAQSDAFELPKQNCSAYLSPAGVLRAFPGSATVCASDVVPAAIMPATNCAVQLARL